MEIMFMGTAAAEGLPALFCKCDVCNRARDLGGKNLRRTTCTIIDETLLIDFGPDILVHTHQHALNLCDLRAILITHSHEDHCFLPDLNLHRPPFGYFADERRLIVMGSSVVEGMFRQTVSRDAGIEFVTLKPFTPIEIDDYLVHPMLAEHGDESEDCFLYAFEKGKTVYMNGNDTNVFPEATWEYLEGLELDAVALDTTIGKNPAKPPSASGHMNIDKVREVRERMIEIDCANESTRFVMNHFSHNGGMMHDEFEEIGNRIGFDVAYDGYLLEL